MVFLLAGPFSIMATSLNRCLEEDEYSFTTEDWAPKDQLLLRAKARTSIKLYQKKDGGRVDESLHQWSTKSQEDKNIYHYYRKAITGSS